jgi:hypothetical protein
MPELISAEERAKLKRMAVVSVRYVPGRSEKYSKSRLARGNAEVGGGIGFAAGLGATAVICVPMAVFPPLAATCFASLGIVVGGAGSIVGENVAKSMAAPAAAQPQPWGNHATVAADLVGATDPGPDEVLREQIRRSLPQGSSPAISILNAQPHPAVEVDYRKFARAQQDFDAAVELTVLGQYLAGDRAGGPERFVLPVRLRVVRLSDSRVLADTVLVDASGEHSAEDWRREEGKLVKEAARESAGVIARRIASGLAEDKSFSPAIR